MPGASCSKENVRESARVDAAAAAAAAAGTFTVGVHA